MDIATIKSRLEQNRIPFRNDLPEKLHIYLSMLREWNSRIDLTAVTEDEETVDKHFMDSLTILKTEIIRNDASLIDVGTGAGFPGMVLAMARPDLKVTLMDSQQKCCFSSAFNFFLQRRSFPAQRTPVHFHIGKQIFT